MMLIWKVQLPWERSKSLKNIMRENGLRNEEIIRTIIIREYESYFAVMCTTWAVVKIRPGKNSGLCGEPMTPTKPVQRFTNPANKPTGSWSLWWFQINPVVSVGRALRRCRRGHGFEFRTGLNFFRPYFHYCSSSVHYCKDRFHIRVFICSSNIWLSYIHSRLSIIIIIISMHQ